MLNTGDFAFDTVAGANVQILERIEMWGYTSYKVFNPATGRVYKATEEQLKLQAAVQSSTMKTTCAMWLCSRKSKMRPPVAFCLRWQAESSRCRTSSMY